MYLRPRESSACAQEQGSLPETKVTAHPRAKSDLSVTGFRAQAMSKIRIESMTRTRTQGDEGQG